jgi:malate dehydrogenase (oxaloacetate-decarboxylating)(NADP+)
MSDPNYYASMMLRMQDADGMVTGASQNYSDAVRPILQTVGLHKDGVPAGINIVLTEKEFLLLGDSTVNLDPTPEQLAQMARQASRIAEYFGQTPRVAMLSYSNFTGAPGTPAKMKKAAELFKIMEPKIVCDGDIQADAAVNTSISKRIFPFSALSQCDSANVLIFPNLESANISYKLLQQIGKVEVIGPFLMGVKQAANVLQRTTTVEGIVHSVVITALEAQYLKKLRTERAKLRS